MKIISIRQPWASLIVNGIKDIENRSWSTNYRGRVLIHASQTEDKISSVELKQRYGVNAPTYRPTGGVIGVADIVDCVEEHDSKWFDGEDYGFVLKNPRSLRFVRWPGQLGLREASRGLLAKIARVAAQFKSHLG